MPDGLEIAGLWVGVERRTVCTQHGVPHQRVRQHTVELGGVNVRALGLERTGFGFNEGGRIPVVEVGRIGGPLPGDSPVRTRLPGELRQREVGQNRSRGGRTDRREIGVHILVGDKEPQRVAQDRAAEGEVDLLALAVERAGVVVVAAFIECVTPIADVDGSRELVAARLGHKVDDTAGGSAVLRLVSGGLELDLLNRVEGEVGAEGGGHRIGGVGAVDVVGVFGIGRAEHPGVVTSRDTRRLVEHALVAAVGRADGRALHVGIGVGGVGVDLRRVDHRGFGHDLDLAAECAQRHLDGDRT